MSHSFPTRRSSDLAHQLVKGALESPTDRRSFTPILLHTWIGVWAVIGTLGSWTIIHLIQRKRLPSLSLLVATTGGLSTIVLGSYGAFLIGWLVPVIPTLSSILASTILLTLAQKQQKLEEANIQLDSQIQVGYLLLQVFVVFERE